MTVTVDKFYLIVRAKKNRRLTNSRLIWPPQVAAPILYRNAVLQRNFRTMSQVMRLALLVTCQQSRSFVLILTAAPVAKQRKP